MQNITVGDCDLTTPSTGTITANFRTFLLRPSVWSPVPWRATANSNRNNTVADSLGNEDHPRLVGYSKGASRTRTGSLRVTHRGIVRCCGTEDALKQWFRALQQLRKTKLELAAVSPSVACFAQWLLQD